VSSNISDGFSLNAFSRPSMPLEPALNGTQKIRLIIDNKYLGLAVLFF
jgi:hypothetical protein